MNSDISIIDYDDSWEGKWDEFVMNHSINGTFLHTRRFLNYHPKERFKDCSKLVLDSKERIIAVCPACIITHNGGKSIFSHKGSTYGGIVLSSKYYKTQKVIDLIEALERSWRDSGIVQVILKQTPDLLSSAPETLFEYCYYYKGYSVKSELNLYVDLNKCHDDILHDLSQGKRTNVHNCEKEGCLCRKLSTKDEIMAFYELLRITLNKYDREPIHTVGELMDFRDERLSEECDFYGVFLDDRMIAGAMMFYFERSRVAHTQYLCADPEYNVLSPMTFMYYSMMCEARNKGYDKISWGIVTEDMGNYLNEGLTKSKEAFGSTYGINHTYIKALV